MNRLKHNVKVLLLYTGLMALFLWVFPDILAKAAILGFFAGLLNDILTQLRKLNGETFKDIEDE